MASLFIYASLYRKISFDIEDNESYDDSIMTKKALSSDTNNRKKVSQNNTLLSITSQNQRTRDLQTNTSPLYTF